jgi:hypothetical protein
LIALGETEANRAGGVVKAAAGNPTEDDMTDTDRIAADKDHVEALGAAIIKSINKYAEKHRGLETADVLSALMQVIGHIVGTSRTHVRQNHADNVRRVTSEVLDSVLAAAEQPGPTEGASGHLH